jgi:AraC family transcriptional regulator
MSATLEPVPGHVVPREGHEILVTRSIKWRGAEFIAVTEDIGEEVTWHRVPDTHSLVVHLGGTLKHFESEAEGGVAWRGLPAPGDMWLVPAGCRYAARGQGSTAHYGELRIMPDIMNQFVEGGCPIGEIPPLLGLRDEFLHQAVRKLASIAGNEDDISVISGHNIATSLCLHIFTTYTASGTSGRSPTRRPRLTSEMRRRCQEHILDNIDKRIMLNEIAAITGLNIQVLLVEFRREFGTTPAQFITGERIRRAQALLANTDDDITTIAFATGFASHSHLTRTFRKVLGITPTDFRRSAR